MPTHRSIAVCVSVFWIGCASDPSSQTLGQEAGDSAAPADDSARCPADTEEFRFGPNGLIRTDMATGISVRLEKASDAPPSRGFNDWTIAVTDQNGAPMAQAELNWACAWMPAHNHGSSPKRVGRPGNGRFELLQQNLSMYGGWQVKLWIDANGSGPVFDPQKGTGIVGGDACRGSGTTAAPNIQFNICVPTTPGE
jgi:hypothetical protein